MLILSSLLRMLFVTYTFLKVILSKLVLLKAVLLSLVFILFTHSSFAQLVQKIEINGLNSIDRGTILSYLPIEVNDEFSPSSIPLIDKNLLDTNFFKKVSTEFVNGTLQINIEENPIIKYVEFKGYKEDAVLSENSIQKIQDNSDIKPGKIFNDKTFNTLLRQIQLLYIDNGYYNSEITFKKNIDNANRIGIEVFFKEGSPALINRFDISGNSFFSSDDLLDLFDIGVPDFFILNYFTEKDRFNKQSLDAGIEKIKTKYLESGFLDIKVKLINPELNSKDMTISIEVNIEEGNQYFVGNIELNGEMGNFSSEKLTSTFGMETGSVFSRKEILKGARKIRALFADNGYAKASIETKLKQNDKPNSFDLILDIKKNKRMYVNRIEIIGNHTTQDDVIRRELNLLEGQEFSQKTLDESIRKIKRLGYFSDVKMNLTEVSGNDDRFDILISVTEAKTGEFTIGLSHGNDSGAAFNVGIQQNNILGTGNVLNAKLVNSKAVEELRVYFKDPHFSDIGDSISYGFFTKTTNAADLEISDYVIDENGINFGYGIQTSKNSDIFSELRLSNIDLTCSATYAGVLYEQKQCASNDSLDFNTSLISSKNSLNDFYNPTDGSKQILKGVISLPLGDFKYFKLEGNQTNFYPINDDSTFKTKFNLQLAQGYGNKDLPFFERYFGGGSSSVRGFDFNSLGSKYPDLTAKGGEVSLLTSGAYIAPAKKIGIDNDNIRISAFLDAGSIYEKVSSFDLSDIRASAGLATSWVTPIGPIGFYFAKPLIKKSSDSTETFSFELGTTF